MLFYPKFYCELNHIKFFWCNKKSWIRRNCKYNIEGLGKDVPKALIQVKSFTILGPYNSYPKKIKLYQENIKYKMGEWIKLISHKTTRTVNDNK